MQAGQNQITTHRHWVSGIAAHVDVVDCLGNVIVPGNHLLTTRPQVGGGRNF